MDLLSSALNVAGQAGDAVDKFTGGRALRGALAGKPRELASVIPFSDTMGLTDERDKTSGRDLTDHYGLTRKGDNSFASHALGFGADMLLNPASLAGGVGAFRAAPTIGKGLVAAGKSVSGLDLLDHIGAGARSLGRFAANESGAVRIPPLPIDAQALKTTGLAANVSRPRRFSVDPARSGWYAADRQARFGRRFGNGLGNTAVPSGIPEFPLLGAIKRFAGDESGHLRHAIPGVDPELANAMDGLGPMYPGGAEKLRSMAQGAPNSSIAARLHELSVNPYSEQIASEIPEGSQFLNHGAEALAFRTPEGGVIRIADQPTYQNHRADIPEILQAYRTAQFGPYQVEHLPQVHPVYESFEEPIKEAGRKIMGMSDDAAAEAASLDAYHAHGANAKMNALHEEMANEMRSSLAHRGYDPWDASAWNTGLTPEGKGIIFDGGAVRGGRFELGRGVDTTIAPKPTYPAPEGDLLRRVMEAGGPEKVRQSLAQGIAEGSKGQGVDMPQLADLLRSRKEVQDFLASQGLHSGQYIPSEASPLAQMSPGLAESYPSLNGAPSLQTVLGTLGATGVGAGLLSYYMHNRGE